MLTTCKTSDNNNQVIVFHAGSLTVPLKEISQKFEEKNPGTDILLEAAGSVASARKITELDRPCDIMASADCRVIERMLIPDYASWDVRFASNSMVIAFTGESDRSDEITRENWADILLNDDIVYGRSDPNSDPCGYRSILTMRLSESYYGIPELAERLIVKDQNMIRPKETDLIALLEVGALDYIFQYKSVSEQHGLRYIELPDEVNLSNQQFEDHYNEVSVEITGKSPGELLEIKGSTMVYGVTLLNDAPNGEAAAEFLEYMLGPEGMAIIEKNGQNLISPPVSGNHDKLPGKLTEICTSL